MASPLLPAAHSSLRRCKRQIGFDGLCAMLAALLDGAVAGLGGLASEGRHSCRRGRAAAACSTWELMKLQCATKSAHSRKAMAAAARCCRCACRGVLRRRDSCACADGRGAFFAVCCFPCCVVPGGTPPDGGVCLVSTWSRLCRPKVRAALRGAPCGGTMEPMCQQVGGHNQAAVTSRSFHCQLAHHWLACRKRHPGMGAGRLGAPLHADTSEPHSPPWCLLPASQPSVYTASPSAPMPYTQQGPTGAIGKWRVLMCRSTWWRPTGTAAAAAAHCPTGDSHDPAHRRTFLPMLGSVSTWRWGTRAAWGRPRPPDWRGRILWRRDSFLSLSTLVAICDVQAT